MLYSRIVDRGIGGLIRAGRLALGLSLRQLARRAGISHSYLALLEANRIGRPSPSVLKRLAETVPGLDYAELLVRAGHLARGEELPAPPGRLTEAELERLTREGGWVGPGLRLIPLVARVPASFAKTGEVLVRLDEEPHFIPVAAEMVEGAGPLFALRVEGGSMVEEGILPGDIVVVEVGREPRDGEIWVFRLAGGEHTLKLVRLGRGELRLVSRAAGGEVARFGKEREDLPVPIGRVVLVMRSYRRRTASRRAPTAPRRSPRGRGDP